MSLATDLDYSSYQDIREESGHQNLSMLETPSGLVNGSNTIFTVGRTYIVDRNFNDTVDVASDVVVYDDGVAVTISAVNVNTGVITLSSAPATNSEVLVSYAHSLLSDTAVGKYRDEAISFIQQRLDGVIDYSIWTDADIPAVIKTITRLYAAGLILIRDYGLNADTDESSKDGYKKLATAKSMLQDYIDNIADTPGSTSRVQAYARSDGNIFERNTDLSTWNESVSQDDAFMRGE